MRSGSQESKHPEQDGAFQMTSHSKPGKKCACPKDQDCSMANAISGIQEQRRRPKRDPVQEEQQRKPALQLSSAHNKLATDCNK